jgi:hypothetical protein
MKMRKILQLMLLVCLMGITSQSFAQRLGIKAGLNLSNMTFKDNEQTYSDDFKSLPGFHAGLTAEFMAGNPFSIETGLLYTTKGFKFSEKETFMGDTYEVEAKRTLHYLEIPLLAKLNVDLGAATLFGTAGPYVAMGIGGNDKYTAKYNNESNSETEDIKWGTDEDKDDLRPLDYGLSFGAGVEIRSIQLGVSYGLGLANISAYRADDDVVKNRVLSVSIGYKFGSK